MTDTKTFNDWENELKTKLLYNQLGLVPRLKREFDGQEPFKQPDALTPPGEASTT